MRRRGEGERTNGTRTPYPWTPPPHRLLGEKRVLQMRLSAATGSTPSDRHPAIPEDDDSGVGRGRLQHHLANLKYDLDTIADQYIQRFENAGERGRNQTGPVPPGRTPPTPAPGMLSPASSTVGRTEDSETASRRSSRSSLPSYHSFAIAPSAETPPAPLSPTTSAADSSQGALPKRVQVQGGAGDWEFAKPAERVPSSRPPKTKRLAGTTRGILARARQSVQPVTRRGFTVY